MTSSSERDSSLQAETWWLEFTRLFEESRKDPATEIGIAYQNGRNRPDVGRSDAAWSDAMFVFLARLASRLGYTQGREVGKIGEFGPTDAEWYLGRLRRPSVVIEHESWLPGGASVKRRGPYYLKVLPKLMREDVPLKIFLTYVECPGDVQRVVADVARIAPVPQGEWILALGPYGWSPTEKWVGYSRSTPAPVFHRLDP